MGVKVIKVLPKKFKGKVFKRAIQQAARNTGNFTMKEYRKTTKTWKKKPVFRKETKSKRDRIEVDIYTNNEIYGYVDKGTKRHDIWAGYYTGKSDKKALSFMAGGTPKTRPGVIGSSSGAKGAQKVLTPYVIDHPGTKARNFTKLIQKTTEQKAHDELTKAIKQAAKDCGHGA